MAVEIEFNTEKDNINKAKHGLPLEFAALLFEGEYKETIDDREDWRDTNNCRRITIRPFMCLCLYVAKGQTAHYFTTQSK